MKYDVILADPPWDFEVWNRDTGSGRSASLHYPTMKLDDICALPISEIAADNCALFIWAIWPRIFDAQAVIKSWGFEYRTLGFEWVKLNKSGLGFYFGMGYYTRANPEPCLLAIKGRMPVATRSERNLLISPVREHSQKPDEAYGKVERLYPGKKYVELFARRRRDGWDAFGNQVQGSIDLNGGA